MAHFKNKLNSLLVCFIVYIRLCFHELRFCVTSFYLTEGQSHTVFLRETYNKDFNTHTPVVIGSSSSSSSGNTM